MNFLQRIKDNLNDYRNNHGRRQQVIVDTSALRELIDRFEDLDTECRALHPKARNQAIEKQLHDTINAVYQKQGKNAETTLMLIMDTLRPLMEERHKQQEIVRRCES